MAAPDFAGLLKQSIGLDAASIGLPAISRAVDERQSICGLQDPLAYWELVRASAAELQELIEAVVVPETWFFRDLEAFAFLRKLVREDWPPAHPDGVLRLLSLPSSTGEEPYSMAMTLLDAGVPADRFRVQGFDVSARALAVADRAVYGRNSFRGRDLAFRARHFDSTPSGHHLRVSVRRQVAFERRNLFAVDVLAGDPTYAVIFCRNLLIYFDRGTQERALGVLGRLLAPDGVLFVAPSEASLLLSHGFASTNVPLAFAFRRAGSVPPGSQHKAAAPTARRRSAVRAVAAPVAAAPARPRAVVPAVARAAPSQADPEASAKGALEKATRLADQGHFDEAVQCCEESLRQSGPSAEIFHLLGVVRDASGDLSEAAACYRKALYLDPHHHQVLIHLALLMERLGQRSDAQVLRQRARRLEQRNTHG